MASTRIGGWKDFLLGWIVASPTGHGTVDIPAFTPVDTTGASIISGGGQNVTIVGPLGQAAMAASLPVVIASNQTAVPASLQAAATGGASYTHIAAGQATTVVKASAGTLYAIVFNGVATATNVTTVYDNASGSGTVIAIPQATLSTGLQPLTFGAAGLAFSNGLTIITTTANGADMTVIWK